MGYYLNAEIGYYEGDPISVNDQEVPQRPDADYSWDGAQWVQNPPPQAPSTDPVMKLKAFLADNPDVAALLK